MELFYKLWGYTIINHFFLQLKNSNMGVMSCSRYDCGNIMCSTYIDNIGYICYECQSEFKDYLRSIDKVKATRKEINRELNTFMETLKGEYVEDNEENDVDDFFNEYNE